MLYHVDVRVPRSRSKHLFVIVTTVQYVQLLQLSVRSVAFEIRDKPITIRPLSCAVCGVGAPPRPTTPILHRHVTAIAVQLFCSSIFVFAAILLPRVQHGRARTAQARRPAAQGRREQAEDRQHTRHQRLQVGVSASRVRSESGRLESLDLEATARSDLPSSLWKPNRQSV